MNKEIKDILYNIKNKYEDYYVQDIVSGNDLKQVLDYITNLERYYKDNVNRYEELIEKYSNLQQELEEEKRIEEADLHKIQRLEEENERLKEWKEDLLKENIELENTRKEAIEYMQENYNELTDYGYKKEIYDDLLNILQKEGDNDKKLLDYITNLQQKYEEADYDRHKLFEENEGLKNHNRWLEDKIEIYFDNVNMQNNLMLEQLDYKSRCEKAYTKLNAILNSLKDYMKGNEEYCKIHTDYIYSLEDLLSILQNGSDNQ